MCLKKKIRIRDLCNSSVYSRREILVLFRNISRSFEYTEKKNLVNSNSYRGKSNKRLFVAVDELAIILSWPRLICPPPWRQMDAVSQRTTGNPLKVCEPCVCEPVCDFQCSCCSLHCHRRLRGIGAVVASLNDQLPADCFTFSIHSPPRNKVLDPTFCSFGLTWIYFKPTAESPLFNYLISSQSSDLNCSCRMKQTFHPHFSSLQSKFIGFAKMILFFPPSHYSTLDWAL